MVSFGLDHRRRTAFRLFSILILLALVAVCFFLPLFSVLTIRDSRTNALMWQHLVHQDTAFAIRWIHSIHRTPVVEYYHVKGTQLQLTDMTFEDYGIGMNSELAPGETMVTENGSFHIQNMNRLFPALHLFIGQVRANHTLLFQGKEYPLKQVDHPGSAISIQVEQQSIYNWIGGY